MKKTGTTAKRIILALLLISVLIIPCGVFAVQCTNANFGTYSYNKKTLNAMSKEYEAKKLKFKQSNKTLEPLKKWNRPNYRLKVSGIYKSKELEQDGIADIILTGDLMCQTRQQQKAMDKHDEYNFNEEFYYLKKIFAGADFVAGNLETTLAESASYMSQEHFVDGRPNCNAPSTFLDALRYAGFDLLVNANNHNCDANLKGIYQTIAHLNQYGFIHTGLFTEENEPRYVVAEIDGIRVGFLSYATYYNHKDENLTRKGKNIFLNYYSKDKLKQDIAAARATGAEYIISYIHWGKEYSVVHNEKQEKIAREMAYAGVDFIVGSHSHTVQDVEIVVSKDGRSVPVLYSMGNLVSHMTGRETVRDSLLVEIQLKKDDMGQVVLASKSYIPCRCMKNYSKRAYTSVPITKWRATKSDCKEDFMNTYKRLKKQMGTTFTLSEQYRF